MLEIWTYILLHILWSDWDSSSCCISFGPTGILPLAWPRSFSFFFIVIIISFFFPSFWDFGPSWSFLISWIDSSFVKTYGLSLLFMEWVFLWNFGPQHWLCLSFFSSFSFFLSSSNPLTNSSTHKYIPEIETHSSFSWF